MDPAVEQGARASAARLRDTLGPDLPAQVEAELHTNPDKRPGQYLDPVSLGALIVSIASLAWTIYKDTRKPDQPNPTADVVARAVRVRLDRPTDLPPEDRARVIEVTVEETLRHAADKS